VNAAAHEWLAKAREDLLAVEKLADDGDLTSIAAFHAQQCAEKSLKAVLEAHGQKVPRTHDLVRLNELVQGCFAVQCDGDVLGELSTVYLEARYPSDLGLLPHGRPLPSDIARYWQAVKAIYDEISCFLENL
jgi:HEPN domain-containing protein